MNRTILIVAGVFGASSPVLIDSAIKGTALLVVAAIAALILRRDSAATRHLVWLLAMASMLVVPVLSAMLPWWRVLPEWVRIRPETAVVSTGPPAMAGPADGAMERVGPANPEDVASPPATAYQPAAGPPDSRPALATPAAIPAPAATSWNWLDTLTLVWALGSGVLILRLLASRWMLGRTERQGLVIRSSGQPTPFHLILARALEAARSQLGIHRPVTLLIHPGRTIPCVWGILRHRLMLPAAAQEWSDEQLRSVLLHELAHIKRRDTLTRPLAQIACAVHWFNPLVWLAGWRLGVECERACDDLVLASGVRPSAYAGHLLDVVTGSSPGGWAQSGGLAMARKSSLERRLVAVLSDRLNRRGVSAAVAALALALAAVIAVPVAMLHAAEDEPGGARQPHIAPIKGLNVLFLQGSNFSWDYKYMMILVASSQDINVQALVIKAKAEGDRGAVEDLEFAPGRYNAYILSDLPANFLTAKQHKLLAESVRQGAGLMMLGGHASFGAGGWADTPLADILPVHIHPGDGRYEPDGGIKFVPTNRGLGSYLLQVGTNRIETARIWDQMKPILGANRFGKVRQTANVLAETPAPNPEPLMVSMEVGKGRSIAYGGNTWLWYRSSEESRLATRKFWRQVVFWLSHKESQADDQVKVTLDRSIPQPKNREAQALFQVWQNNSRMNGAIPGGLIRRLGDKMKEFIRLNTGDAGGDAYAKKMAPLVPRCDAARDWTPAEAVALLDDIAAVIDIPLDTSMDDFRNRVIRTGEPLPPSLANAPWGQALPNGLRMAWVLEPRAAQYRLGTPLKSRILIHNSGQTPVVFRTRTWHQSGGHKARDAKGADIRIDSTEWTRIAWLVPYRLAPGEFVELDAAGIGVGSSATEAESHGTRLGAWVEAKAGDEVTFSPDSVPLSDWIEAPPSAGEPGWWSVFITERVNRESPLPATADERTRLLDRVLRDLFGAAPTPEETTAFTADASPAALDSLARRLVRRPGLTLFTGALTSGQTTFRVLPADPNAAKTPRTASSPGHYPLGDNARLVVSHRPVGARIVNEASMQFFSSDPNRPAPGKPHEIRLPDGYNTWAAAWVRGSNMLWVLEEGTVHRYDFTNPANVKETTFEQPAHRDKVPGSVLDALRSAIAAPAAPAAPG